MKRQKRQINAPTSNEKVNAHSFSPRRTENVRDLNSAGKKGNPSNKKGGFFSNAWGSFKKGLGKIGRSVWKGIRTVGDYAMLGLEALGDGIEYGTDEFLDYFGWYDKVYHSNDEPFTIDKSGNGEGGFGTWLGNKAKKLGNYLHGKGRKGVNWTYEEYRQMKNGYTDDGERLPNSRKLAEKRGLWPTI